MNEEETKRYVALIEERDMYKAIVENYHGVMKSQMIENLLEAGSSNNDDYRDYLDRFNELREIFLKNNGDLEQIKSLDKNAKDLERELKSMETKQ